MQIEWPADSVNECITLKKLESFLQQSSELINSFNLLHSELNIFEQPDTKDQCQEELHAHTNLKQTLFSMSIEPVVNEGRELLKVLNGANGMGLDNQQFMPGTRDSGYSGSINEITGIEKFHFDYFNEAIKIKEPIEQLRVAKQKLQNAWQQKKVKLEQCLQLRMFEQDFNQVSI
jgi:hypothetical protein